MSGSKIWILYAIPAGLLMGIFMMAMSYGIYGEIIWHDVKGSAIGVTLGAIIMGIINLIGGD